MNDVERFLRDTISDIDAHFDRVARVNLPIVISRIGSPLGEEGYRNSALLDGANIVMAYLRDLAEDQGINLEVNPE